MSNSEEKTVRNTVPLKPQSAIPPVALDLGEQQIAETAYELWQSRGCPGGSPEEDWFRAIEELKKAK